MDYRPTYPWPLRWLGLAVDAGLVVGGIAIVVLVFSNAFLRGAAGFDLAWSLEVTAFLLLWTTFLGCAAAVARGSHMRVTEVVETLVPKAGQRWLSLTIDLVVAAVLVSLIWHGWKIAARTWEQDTTVLYWPVGLLYASMPAGMALSLVFHLFNMVRDLTHPHGMTPVHGDGGEDIQ